MREIKIIDGKEYDYCEIHDTYFPARLTKALEQQKNESLINKGIYLTNLVACPICYTKEIALSLIKLTNPQLNTNRKAITYKDIQGKEKK